MPASRRTRAVLGFLLLTDRSHRRERLCELFWWMPDDPRGALRWSLSKIRPIVNDDGQERLVADRERVVLDTSHIEIDRRSCARQLLDGDLNVEALERLIESLSETLLEGVDLSDQQEFQAWLTAEREQTRRLQEQAISQLALHPDLAPEQQLPQARAWCDAEPFNPAAANTLLARLEQFGHSDQASELRIELIERFRKASIDFTPDQPSTTGSSAVDESQAAAARLFQMRQKIQFCKADDGVRIAYATVGEGPPLVKAANWLSHLELDWDAPIWSPLFRQLAMNHRLVRYDERGNGLSDWDVAQIGIDAFVADLETVVDAAGEEQFALLGISQGAAVSIAYAVRHPERVSKLILFGGYPAGWRIDASEELISEREAIMTLTAAGWGQDNPAYRQIFSSTFMPSATAEELSWFNEFQRLTTSPENAVRFLSAFGDIDVRDQLAKLRVPTLVIHSLNDQRIPVDTGLELAMAIPNAEFVGLDSDNHLLLGREPASDAFVSAIEDFLKSD